MTRVIRSVAMALVMCLMLSMCGFGAACEDISDRILRLHILAASDSKEDQQLKLKVRDRILQETKGLLDGTYTKDLAKVRLAELLPQLEQAAEETLRQNGSSDKVTAQLCETYFTTRCYESAVLPAGTYDALRIIIGEGDGQNWWCVVFPPMCISGACETSLDAVLTEQETAIVTTPSRYEVRFKIVEWFSALENWITA